MVTHCVTRLRFRLHDENLARHKELEALPEVLSVIRTNGQYQVVISPHVYDVMVAAAGVVIAFALGFVLTWLFWRPKEE